MLKLEYVKKRYGSFELDCTMEVKPGFITGLVGQNGSGKSTTFKAALGLISMDSGRIEILGKDIRELSARDKENIGVSFSDSGFSEYLTVKDVAAIMPHFYKKFDKAFFMKQAEHFNLPVNKPIKEFSTGMKAKIKMLIAISHHAKLLILDEPTSGLDIVARTELLGLLREYMEEDEERAILISSHISTDLETLCDDLYMIHEGKIALHEETDVLLSNYAILKVREEEYRQLDKHYILRVKEESYGYSCLTNQKKFYVENYPSITIEKGTIDEVITMIIRGETL